MIMFHLQEVEIQLLGRCGLIMVEGFLLSADWAAMFY